MNNRNENTGALSVIKNWLAEKILYSIYITKINPSPKFIAENANLPFTKILLQNITKRCLMCLGNSLVHKPIFSKKYFFQLVINGEEANFSCWGIIGNYSAPRPWMNIFFICCYKSPGQVEFEDVLTILTFKMTKIFEKWWREGKIKHFQNGKSEEFGFHSPYCWFIKRICWIFFT